MHTILWLIVSLFGVYRLLEAAGYYPIDRSLVESELIGVATLRELGVKFVIIDD